VVLLEVVVKYKCSDLVFGQKVCQLDPLGGLNAIDFLEAFRIQSELLAHYNEERDKLIDGLFEVVLLD